MIRKWIAGAAAGAALVLSGSMAVGQADAAPASPAAGWDRCPAGNFCIFDGPNGTGGMAWFQSGSADLRGQGMDNRTTSYWNRSSSTFTMYDGYNYTGEDACITANSGPWTITGHYDNVASSVKATPGRTCPL
ncbi:peptidase inhibitor family I36 protein [Streptomyces sp. B3I8]|uniref:peptidase inhibitor family I36 protein n=1 Tax=Streptomyces sp. B3I8 TaxID=3042303 RepID=UPI00277E7830|nr:peptidase inhibitor family I36 protein [Streptomyces sp. B3I8]MDQ0784596.1 hypothetical protein [Streptomyces sp. B3I8]